MPKIVDCLGKPGHDLVEGKAIPVLSQHRLGGASRRPQAPAFFFL